MFAIPQPNHERSGDDELALQGAQLFTELGCRTCHSGPAFTNNATVPFGSEVLQVPNLRSVALRPPYMHDGRCESLECATLEMVEKTTQRELDLEDLTALVAYLETL